MDVIVVRHAHAFERDAERWPDDRKRPLTGDGVRRFRKIARRLARLLPEVDVVCSSELVRAWQTALILEEKAGWPAPHRARALEPGAPIGAVFETLRRHGKAGRIAVVGHEPDLGRLIACMIGAAHEQTVVRMKKGGVAHLCFARRPDPGGGTLLWLAAPKMILGSGVRS